MIKKINTKTIKLIKFYNFINYNLILSTTNFKLEVFTFSNGQLSNRLSKVVISCYCCCTCLCCLNFDCCAQQLAGAVGLMAPVT